ALEAEVVLGGAKGMDGGEDAAEDHLVAELELGGVDALAIEPGAVGGSKVFNGDLAALGEGEAGMLAGEGLVGDAKVSRVVAADDDGQVRQGVDHLGAVRVVDDERDPGALLQAAANDFDDIGGEGLGFVLVRVVAGGSGWHVGLTVWPAAAYPGRRGG